MRLPRCILALVGAFIITAPQQAIADLIFEALPRPVAITQFTISFEGHLTGPPGSTFNLNGTGYTVTITIDGNNTDMVVTPNAPAPMSGFGIMGGGGMGGGGLPIPRIPRIDIQEQSTITPPPTLALPATTATDNATGASEFVVLYAQEALSGGASGVGEWYELPFNPANNVVTVSNSESSPITLSDAGFFISDTLIPLDQLNATDLPPSSFPFTPFPGLDTTIGAGGSVSGLVTPEPSSLALWGLGGVGLLIWRRRRGAALREI